MSNTALSLLLAQELLSAHALMMRCGASALRILDAARPVGTAQLDLRSSDEAMRMAGLSARLMGFHTGGVRLLRRLPPAAGASAIPPVVQPASDATAETPSAIRKLHADPGASRGRLRNGNPSGDYLKSPRCGARTRAGGCCRQPATANGRCRMHGGLSTGPRSPEGQARCRTSRLVHGYRTRAHLDLRSRAAHAARRLRDLTAQLRASAAGHGLHRPEIRSQKSEGRTQRLNARRMAAGSPAGHGLHSSVRDHLRSSASICGSKPFPPTPTAPMRNFVLQSAAALR
jgi:hypothetical protein